MKHGDQAPRDWWIVFSEGAVVSWMDRWQEPGFHHVYAARWDGRQWLRFQPTLSGFEIEALPMIGYDAQDRILRGTVKILVETRPPSRIPRIPWGIAPATCVEAIKHLIGIRAPLVFTPYQLFNYLRAGKHMRSR